MHQKKRYIYTHFSGRLKLKDLQVYRHRQTFQQFHLRLISKKKITGVKFFFFLISTKLYTLLIL